MKNFNLLDTINLMASDDYKERFRAEYWQTKARWDKLRAMLEKYEAGTLEFTPTCPIDLLKRQASVMEQYLIALNERAKVEKIDLYADAGDLEISKAGTLEDPNLAAFWKGVRNIIREIIEMPSALEIIVATAATTMSMTQVNFFKTMDDLAKGELHKLADRMVDAHDEKKGDTETA